MRSSAHSRLPQRHKAISFVEYIRNSFPELESYAGDRSLWLGSQPHFERIKTLWKEGRIKGVVGDWSGQALPEIGRFLRSRDLAVSILYVSNMFAYRSSLEKTKRILANIETLPKADYAVVISAEKLLGANIAQPWSISHYRFWQERGKYHDGFFSAMEQSSQWLWAFQQGRYENGLQFLKQIGRGGVIPNRELSQRYLSDALGWLGTNSAEMPQMRSFVESAVRDLRREGLLAVEKRLNYFRQDLDKRLTGLMKRLDLNRSSDFESYFAGALGLDQRLSAAFSRRGGSTSSPLTLQEKVDQLWEGVKERLAQFAYTPSEIKILDDLYGFLKEEHRENNLLRDTIFSTTALRLPGSPLRRRSPKGSVKT